MKITIAAAALLSLAACSAGAPTAKEESFEATEQALVPPGGQGSTYQGSTYQGSTYQGSTYQGSTYQGSTYQGATYGGSSLQSASVSGTRVVAWRWDGKLGRWEQRGPDKICYWNQKKTVSLGCTTVTLSKFEPGFLAGSQWRSTYVLADDTVRTATIRIDRASKDTGAGFFASSTSSACGGASDGNGDVYLYGVSLLDDKGTKSAADDVWLPFCDGGGKATALGGVWLRDADGKETGVYADSSTQFTLGCTSGAIAKCVRWGYKPWKYAAKDGTGACTSLRDYHLACTRAATADYCGTGTSYTVDGTLVDVWDDDFSPRTSDVITWAQAFIPEATFDKEGGICMENLRYEELQAATPFATECPGRFSFDPTPDDVIRCGYTLSDGTTVARWAGPTVHVDTTSSYSHSEKVRGRWLHRYANLCTPGVCTARPYCCSPTDARGWDAACVTQATGCSAILQSVPHGECSTGVAIDKWTNGCTLRLCTDPAYAYCCTGTWDAACVTAAKARCPINCAPIFIDPPPIIIP